MADPRQKDLARVLVHHSCRVQPGEKVLVEASDVPAEFLSVLLQEICDAGGLPILEQKTQLVQRKLLHNATEARIKAIAEIELHRMKQVQCYMAIRGIYNSKELSDVPGDKMSLYEKLWVHPVHLEQRVRHTKWVILKIPSPQFAQMAKMPMEAFEDFFYRVCTKVDWAKANKAMVPLKELMLKTDKVHIKGPGETDLRFSIKGIGAEPCGGQMNIPDLECFSAPVKDSVEGIMAYNTASSYRGFTFENVKLKFSKGKIVEATANDTKRINEIFDTDPGARYVGEFSLAFHPYILEPMDDILFDEKIAGSLHFTPGAAYEGIADNGNRSSVHWDMVLIQRPEYGGGEIYFDDKLVRKDGRFVIPELEGLNPENLKME
jgi:aminopeptidase